MCRVRRRFQSSPTTIPIVIPLQDQRGTKVRQNYYKHGHLVTTHVLQTPSHPAADPAEAEDREATEVTRMLESPAMSTIISPAMTPIMTPAMSAPATVAPRTRTVTTGTNFSGYTQFSDLPD